MADLIIASKNGYYNKVVEHLQAGSSVKARDRDNATALYWSACRGYPKICKALVIAGSDINSRVKWGSTSLHACADRGHETCVRILISYGADLNAQNVRGDTALHLGGYRGYAEIVQILLDARANASLLNEKKKTAEQEARGQGHIRVANILQNHMQANPRQTEGFVPHLGFEPNVCVEEAPITGIDNKENLGRQWNELSVHKPYQGELSDVTMDSVLGTTGHQINKRVLPGRTVLRSSSEPQESEEPSSPLSWDCSSTVDSCAPQQDNNYNEKQPYSDTIKGKRLKRPTSLSGMPVNTTQSAIVREKASIIAASNIVGNGHLNWQMSEFSDNWNVSDNRSSFAVANNMTSTGLRKPPVAPTSGNVGSQDLFRQLETISLYAENLQMKLVMANDKMGKLETENTEKFNHIEQHKHWQNQMKKDMELLQKSRSDESDRLKSRLFDEQKWRVQLEANCVSLTEELEHVKLQLFNTQQASFSDLVASRKLREPVLMPREPRSLSSIEQTQDWDLSEETLVDTTVISPVQLPPASVISRQQLHSGESKTTHTDLFRALQICAGSKILTDNQLHLQNKHYRAVLKSKWDSGCCQRKPLDSINKEWKPGRDYLVMGDKPLNQKEEGYREGSCSLVFQITVKEEPYILKMMINLINMVASDHGKGQSMPRFLARHFGAEYDIPLRIPPHHNVVQVLHYYQGSTRVFQQFLSLIIPNTLDVPIEMANRTTFMVLPEYPLTLRSFMVDQRTKQPIPPYDLSENFLLHLLYQLLAAVDHLQQNGVVHRDIKADNVFLDNHLQPVVGDFGFARRFHRENGEKLMFTDNEQVLAGNPNAWAPELARLNRDGPESLPKLASLEELYKKADAYAVSRMFYSILRPLDEADTFPQSSVNVPHYLETDIPQLPACFSPGLKYILHQLVLDDPLDRPTAHQALVSVGTLLFGPDPGQVNSAGEFMSFYQSKLLQHLARSRNTRSSDHGLLSVEDSLARNSPDLEMHLITHATPQQLWESYRTLKRMSLCV